ncbi:hypothetical protein [Stenotrophomonas phage StenR_269]|nr:hypothetical protein [Stenotrophomonas phage StenR_269]
MSLYRNTSTGVDLDSIFTPRVVAAGPVSGFRNLDGQDLNMRYEAYNGISPASPVGYRGPDGQDISLYYATSPTGGPVNFNVKGTATNTTPGGSGSASITFNPNGSINVTTSTAGGDAGFWYSVILPGVGADYDVLVSGRSAGAGTWTGPFDTWTRLDSLLPYTLFVTSSDGTHIRTATGQVRRRSDNVVVCSGPMTWQIDLGIPP